MIDGRLIARARRALETLMRAQWDGQDKRGVAQLCTELVEAIEAGDATRFRSALGGLERLGSHRGDPALHIGTQNRLAGLPPWFPDLVAAEAAVDAFAPETMRIPHIDVGHEQPLGVGTRFIAIVYLDTTPGGTDETAEPMPQPTPTRALDIDVWLTGSAHFDVLSASTAQISLAPGERRSTEAHFEVAVRPDATTDTGAPALQASFDYRLRAAGRVRRDLSVMLADGTVLSKPADETDDDARLAVDDRRAGADLLVRIERARDLQYSVLLRTQLLGGLETTGEWELPRDAEAYTREVMAHFTDKNASPTSRRRSLEGAGVTFFDAAPECFKQLYWRCVDAGTPPTSMSLVSAERAVPWELMIPHRRSAAGAWESHPALGTHCAIGRWHGGVLPPLQEIPLSDSLVLAPDYPASKRLKNAAAERDVVLGWFAGAEIPATFDAMEEFFVGNDASLLHFVCHGSDATVQELLLLQRQTFRAQQLPMSSMGAACRARRPLVFLNACEVGRPGAGLIAPGGFPAKFIESDAAAVIAPLWAVEDDVAHQVAVELYERVVAGESFADVVRSLRAKAYVDGGADSFAAYCFYGDPLAVSRPE